METQNLSEKKPFKAFIRVVKSITFVEPGFGFEPVEVIREPVIYAFDKAEVKTILLEKYPQFFQNGKIYEKETKDKAQFFYVVIFPLYKFEIDSINEGEWVCDQCGHVHENKYIHRPVTSQKFPGLNFCGNDRQTDNNTYGYSCYEKWKSDRYKTEGLPDDLAYVTQESVNYIYKITEKSTGKCYIGKTRNFPFFRWWNHLKHSQSPFGIHLRKTNLSDWCFEVLEELPASTENNAVLRIESEYIMKHDCINNGYNTVISNKSVK